MHPPAAPPAIWLQTGVVDGKFNVHKQSGPAMHERDLLPILLGTLVATPLLARWAGARTAHHLRAVPGQGRRWMPSLPEQQPDDGTPAARFDAAVRRAERRAVPLLLAEQSGETLTGIQAEVLAGKLDVPVAVARAMLDNWRRRMPCRLRVTQSGAMLHDFARGDLKGAVREAWDSLPQRMFLMFMSIMANLGATWWVIVGVLIGVASLTAVFRAPEMEAQIIAALKGVGALVSVFALSQLGAWLVRLVALRRFPRMARPEYRAKKKTKPVKPKKVRVEAAQEEAPEKESKSWLDGLDGLGSVDGEGCMGLILVVLVAILASAMIGGLVVVGIWLRGLWQVARQLGEPVRDLAPVVWLREAKSSAKWERWIPTNDLAMRLVRALRRTLSARPADERISGQVLARAKRQNGRVAAVEIALDLGLDVSTAISVGSRLIGRLGGDLEVSDAGDIDFIFESEMLDGASTAKQGLELEYLHAGPDEMAPLTHLPVNIPGLTLDHVDGAARLAGGPLATVAVMAATLLGGRGDLPIHGLDLSLGALFCVLAPGTLVLAAVTRQAVAESAAQGILRDIRRVAVARAAEVLGQPVGNLDADAVCAALHPQIAELGLQWTLADVRTEVGNAWADLGIEPDLRGGSKNPRWSTAELRERQKSLEALRSGTAVKRVAGSDEIVFDSQAQVG